VTACTHCGGQLASVPPAPGFLTPRWGHAIPPADGHEPGVPPVTVTYSRDGAGWAAECPEVPGFPVRAAVSLDEAKSVAWVLLGRIGPPPRPVIECAA
jgi:hypothetical protein